MNTYHHPPGFTSGAHSGIIIPQCDEYHSYGKYGFFALSPKFPWCSTGTAHQSFPVREGFITSSSEDEQQLDLVFMNLSGVDCRELVYQLGRQQAMVSHTRASEPPADTYPTGSEETNVLRNSNHLYFPGFSLYLNPSSTLQLNLSVFKTKIWKNAYDTKK